MPNLDKCPICGGENTIIVANLRNKFADYCLDCGLILGLESIDTGLQFNYKFSTREEAAKAWNTRQERTCRVMVPSKPMFVDDYFRCSECDAIMYPHFKYCPNCGAKVVHDAKA